MAKKYGVSYNTLRKHAEGDGWYEERTQIERKGIANAHESTVNAISDNAAKKQRIASLLLECALDTIEDRKARGVFKPQDLKLLSGFLKDFESTALAADTTDDPLMDLLARWDDACK